MRIYSTAEAGEALGVTAETIRGWIDKGLLQAERRGIRPIYRIREDELQRFAQVNNTPFTPKAE